VAGEEDDRHRESIDDAKRFISQAQKLQKYAANVVERLPQVASPVIETILKKEYEGTGRGVLAKKPAFPAPSLCPVLQRSRPW